MSVELLERARIALLQTFGDRWRAPYAEGKAEMADQICQDLGVPHETAVALIKDLERTGVLRFVGAAGAKAAAPLSPAGCVPTLTPTAVPTNAGVVGPESGAHRPVVEVLGDWTISARVV